MQPHTDRVIALVSLGSYAKSTLFLGRADSTVMRKWKQLLMMAANAISRISMATEFSNLCQGGTNASMCLVTVVLGRNKWTVFNVVMT
jgi:hypothetical protein